MEGFSSWTVQVFRLKWAIWCISVNESSVMQKYEPPVSFHLLLDVQKQMNRKVKTCMFRRPCNNNQKCLWFDYEIYELRVMSFFPLTAFFLFWIQRGKKTVKFLKRLHWTLVLVTKNKLISLQLSVSHFIKVQKHKCTVNLKKEQGNPY